MDHQRIDVKRQESLYVNGFYKEYLSKFENNTQTQISPESLVRSYVYTGQFKKASEMLENREGDIDRLDYYIINSELLIESGQYLESLAFLERRLKGLDTRKEQSYGFQFVALKGITLRLLGRLSESKILIESILEELIGISTFLYHRSLINLGVIFLENGSTQEAIEVFNFVISQNPENKFCLAEVFHYLGEAWGNLGHFNVSLDHLDSAANIFSTVGARKYLVKTRVAIAYTYRSQQRYQSSLEILNQVKETLSEVSGSDVHLNLGWCFCAIGEVLIDQAKYDEATKNLLYAIEQFSQIENTILISRCLTDLAIVRMKTGIDHSSNESPDIRSFLSTFSQSKIIIGFYHIISGIEEGTNNNFQNLKRKMRRALTHASLPISFRQFAFSQLTEAILIEGLLQVKPLRWNNITEGIEEVLCLSNETKTYTSSVQLTVLLAQIYQSMGKIDCAEDSFIEARSQCLKYGLPVHLEEVERCIKELKSPELYRGTCSDVISQDLILNDRDQMLKILTTFRKGNWSWISQISSSTSIGFQSDIADNWW